MKRILAISVLGVVLGLGLVPGITLAANPSPGTPAISPTSPKDGDNLTATYTYTDPDGNLENIAARQIKWYKGGAEQAGYANQQLLLADATAVNDKWKFSIKVCDVAAECSAFVDSAEVTILAGGPAPTGGGPGATIPTGLCGDAGKTIGHKIKGCEEAPVNCPKGATCTTEACCLLDMIYTVADWIFVILLVVSGIFIVWGGIEFVTSGGVPEKITSGRNKLIWALVGVVIAFVARGLVVLITQIIK